MSTCRFGTGFTLQARVKLPPPLLTVPKQKTRKPSLRERLSSRLRHHSSSSIGSSPNPTSPGIFSPQAPGTEDPFGHDTSEDSVFYSPPPAFNTNKIHHQSHSPLQCGSHAVNESVSHAQSNTVQHPPTSPSVPSKRKVYFRPAPISLPKTIPENAEIDLTEYPSCNTPRTPGTASLPPASPFASRPKKLLRSLSGISMQSFASEHASFNPYDTTALCNFIETAFPDSVLLEEHQVNLIGIFMHGYKQSIPKPRHSSYLLLSETSLKPPISD